jgi:hypothetical protein
LVAVVLVVPQMPKEQLVKILFWVQLHHSVVVVVGHGKVVER